MRILYSISHLSFLSFLFTRTRAFKRREKVGMPQEDYVPVVVTRLPPKFDFSALRTAFAVGGSAGRSGPAVDATTMWWGQAAPHGTFVLTYLRSDVANAYIAAPGEKPQRIVRSGKHDLLVQRLEFELPGKSSSDAAEVGFAPYSAKPHAAKDRAVNRKRPREAEETAVPSEVQQGDEGEVPIAQPEVPVHRSPALRSSVKPHATAVIGDACKHCGSTAHLSRRCPAKQSGATEGITTTIPTMAVVETKKAPEPESPPFNPKKRQAPTVVKEEHQPVRQQVTQERGSFAPAAPSAPKRGQGDDTCKHCGSTEHLSRRCPKK